MMPSEVSVAPANIKECRDKDILITKLISESVKVKTKNKPIKATVIFTKKITIFDKMLKKAKGS